MLRRVDSMDDLKKAKSSSNPEKWTDSDLLETSLSTLSKTLSHSLTNRRTLAVYFKWLEVHRRKPSELTRAWDNTLLHWAQALRARGFDKEELIAAVKKWKEENGPFDSPAYVWGHRRCPPMSYDIAKAWGDTPNQIPVLASGSGKQGDSWRPGRYHSKNEDYEGLPPGDYVCNRCGTTGHYLQVCPTNMDPSFDKAPNMNYRCPICHENGLHYKSLCPLNTDPFCIIQKRRDLGIETPGVSSSGILRDWQRKIDEHENDDLFRGRQLNRSWGRDSEGTANRTSPNWSPSDEIMSPSPNYSPTASKKSEEIMQRIKEIDNMKMRIARSDSVQTADISMIRNKVNGGRTSEKRTRASSPDPSSIRSRRSINEKSPSPTKSDTLRKKMRIIESHEAWTAQGGEIDSETKAMIAKKAVYQARLDALENSPEPSMMDRDYEVDTEIEDFPGLAFRPNAPSSKRAKPSSHHRQTSPASVDDMDMDIDLEESKANFIKHSDFIQRLIDRHPEILQVVNPSRRAKTALGMWDDDDDRRMKMLALSNAQKSPSFRPFDPDSDDYNPAAMHQTEDCAELNEWVEDKHRTFKSFSGFGTPFNSTKKENVKPRSNWS